MPAFSEVTLFYVILKFRQPHFFHSTRDWLVDCKTAAVLKLIYIRLFSTKILTTQISIGIVLILFRKYDRNIYIRRVIVTYELYTTINDCGTQVHGRGTDISPGYFNPLFVHTVSIRPTFPSTVCSKVTFRLL